MDSREKARAVINETDAQIRELFRKRMEAVAVIADYKKEHGLPIEDKEREAALIARGCAEIPDAEIREYYIRFQRSMMEISKAYQRRRLSGMRVAYSGVEGAFAWIAAKRIFKTAIPVAYPDFASAYRAAEKGEADAAVLPTENSYAGDVGQVMDLIFSGNLCINGIYELPVDQHLLTLPGADTKKIKKVYSHPQALSQCAPFLEAHGWEPIPYGNTAAAAKFVSEAKDETVAAVGSEETAALYGLCVAERSIQRDRSNTTRFAVLCPDGDRPHTEGVHCVLTFTVRNQAGCLAEAIGVIGKYGYNMRVLCSRPMKTLAWQYYFYIEIEGNIDTEKGRSMLEELGGFCDRLRVMGQFVPGRL